MSTEFTDLEIEKIEKNIKVQFSNQADTEESIAVDEKKRKRKMHAPDFKVGDIFNIKDKKYVITNAETKLLILVIAKDWRKEGYGSPEEAREDYKRKGYFGERIIDGKPRLMGDDDFLLYMHTYELTPLNLDAQLAELQVQQIKDKYEENIDTRKSETQDRKKEEAWIKSHPDYCIEIMHGADINDIRQEMRWRNWEKHYSRRKFR